MLLTEIWKLFFFFFSKKHFFFSQNIVVRLKKYQKLFQQNNRNIQPQLFLLEIYHKIVSNKSYKKKKFSQKEHRKIGKYSFFAKLCKNNFFWFFWWKICTIYFMFDSGESSSVNFYWNFLVGFFKYFIKNIWSRKNKPEKTCPGIKRSGFPGNPQFFPTNFSSSI